MSPWKAWWLLEHCASEAPGSLCATGWAMAVFALYGLFLAGVLGWVMVRGGGRRRKNPWH